MTSRRSSAPNSATQQGFASSYLWGSVLRTAAKSCAVEAQKKIDARHEAALHPPPRPGHGNRKYSIELIDEVKAMYAAGWKPREICRVYPEIKKASLMSILYNMADGLSAARAKGYYKK